MPTYEYLCTKCNKGFEVFQSMKDDAFKVCPKALCCEETWGEGVVERQIGTGAGLIFKGSGFYITDYRSDKYKASASKDVASSSEPKKSESKPAEKPKPKATE
ncbi:MAG: hypothetical protein JWL90_536 [Chthoniobacteraceae bacterium]|nr:hypothetical protein [Chthoniobacteraceae bacterium]